MHEWQSSETAPKDGSNFIAWDSRHGRLLFTMHWNAHSNEDGDGYWSTEYEPWSGSFSHWMPLPPVPFQDDLETWQNSRVGKEAI